MIMKKREKFEGTEMADIMWNMVENSRDPAEPDVICGKVYWEDCLEFADKLHRMGYRRVAEPENHEVIRGEVLDS
jgi:hypothetical protein